MKLVFRFVFKSSGLLLIVLFLRIIVPAEQNDNPAKKPITHLLLKPLRTIGPNLPGGLELTNPTLIAANSMGECFIFDASSNTIHRLTNEFEFDKSFSVVVPDSRIMNATCLQFDSALNLYIVDFGGRRILVFDRSVNFVKVIDTYFNENGISTKFSAPRDLAIDKEGNFWIADNDRILKTNQFLELTSIVTDILPAERRPGTITALWRNSGGNIIAGDSGNNRLLIFSPNGNLISELKVAPFADLVTDCFGNYWSADLASGRIQAFSASGLSLFDTSKLKVEIKGRSIAILPTDKLAVIDPVSRQIKIFQIIFGDILSNE